MKCTWRRMRDQIYLQTSKKSKFYDDLSHKENPIITFFYTSKNSYPHAGIKSILKTNIPCYNITVMKLELHVNIF